MSAAVKKRNYFSGIERTIQIKQAYQGPDISARTSEMYAKSINR